MNEEEKFGSHLEIDKTNRLDVLKEEKVPDYICFGRLLRAQLQRSLVESGYPQRPAVETIEDLFLKANERTTERWEAWTGDILNKKFQEWANSLPDDQRYVSLRELLGNSRAMEEKLLIRQFGVLESLRKVNPEAWKSLLVASSERQLASLVLVRRWLEEMTDQEVEKMGMSKVELRLFTDIAGILGKYFDQAYIKQIEMADAPGGSAKTPLGEKIGSSYVYDVPSQEDENKLDIKTYNQIFPFEWPLITRRMKMLALRTKRMIRENKLDKSYQSLGFALQRMGKVYGFETTDLAKLDEAWNQLYRISQDTLEKCPLSLIPQGAQTVAGEAEKIDVEFRLGIRTPKNKEIEKIGMKFRDLAQGMVDAHKEALKSKEFQVSTPLVTFQPFAFGPNLSWVTQGESGFGTNLIHENAVREVAQTTELRLLGKIFPREELDKEFYQQAAVLETVLHETGHELISTDDSAVEKRIGIGQEADIIEELKAETVGMSLLDEGLKQKMSGVDAKYQFLAKMGTLLDYVLNKLKEPGESEEKYYFSGIGALCRLLKTEGILRKVEGGWEIIDGRKGIAILGELGWELISFYADKRTNPESVKRYVNSLKEGEDDLKVREFIGVLREQI